jgi:hypothetical protein
LVRIQREITSPRVPNMANWIIAETMGIAFTHVYVAVMSGVIDLFLIYINAGKSSQGASMEHRA